MKLPGKAVRNFRACFSGFSAVGKSKEHVCSVFEYWMFEKVDAAYRKSLQVKF
jgi:hypothetical protein